MSRNNHNPADFIVPLNINGLEGRMLNMPSKKKNAPNILFIYGQHSSLERWMGIAEELSKLGNVVMPDLPGLGGMDSLYHIGQPATIDNMADYLATFIKLKYKGKKVIVIGMSLGFVVVTRMLLTALNPMVISYVYHRTRHAKEKFENISGDEFKRTMDTEIKLWHDNDIRTQFKNYREMFHLDNTKIKIPLPVYHVAAKKDRYFDNTRVEEHMRQVFTDFTVFYTQAPNHAPTIIATAKEAAPFIPPALRKQIAKTKVK
jgi:hypothetical protein